MIKIHRISAPHELTPEVKEQLTNDFKADSKKAVWNKSYIREGLLKMSHNKCCYCECLIGDGEGEVHIDHFMPKSIYPDLVVDWGNLLPSCSHCNKNKSTHDPSKERIIDPTQDDPKSYFYLKLYRYYSKDSNMNSIGKTTIDVLALNDSDTKVLKRYQLGNALSERIQDVLNLMQECNDMIITNTRKRNKIINSCKDILKFGLPTAQFSAFMATIICHDADFHELKKCLKKYGLWDEELQVLYKRALENSFNIEN